jgi:hypothetical protein
MRFPSTHAQRLERWLGADVATGISEKMSGWYGPPIPIFGVPGRVYAAGGGDFVGAIDGGFYGNLAGYATDRAKRVLRAFARSQASTAGIGFASLSDLISEATTGGKAQTLSYQKTGPTAPAVSATVTTWALGALPSAGANSGGAPGGTVPTNTTTGGLQQVDPAGTDTLHLTTWTGQSTVAGATLLYDFLFGVTSTFATGTSANLAITGVPTRYQTAALAPGNFASIRVAGVMNATGTNFNLFYVDQAGNAAELSPVIAARTSSAVETIPLTQPAWFLPLNAGDTGLRSISNIRSSGNNNGVGDWFIGHPLAILPTPVASIPFVLDGINSAFNLAQVQNGACLALLDWMKASVTASTMSGIIQLVSG